MPVPYYLVKARKNAIEVNYTWSDLPSEGAGKKKSEVTCGHCGHVQVVNVSIWAANGKAYCRNCHNKWIW